MRALKAATAVVLLVALLAAPPWLLVRLVGNPWPAEGMSLDAPLTDDAVIGILAVFLWILWAQFAVCVLAELAAALTDDRVRSQVPAVFGFQQQLARRLVSAIVIATVSAPLLGSGGAAAEPHHLSPTDTAEAGSARAAAVSTDGSRHATGSPPDAVNRGTPQGSMSGNSADPDAQLSSATTRTVTVMRLDTLWSIAERELGNGEQWTEIAQLNDGRAMSDGSTFASADHIRPGWKLLVPADADAAMPDLGEVEVHAGDSLSLIAEQELGDATKWPQVYDLNRQTIGSDPDVIHPGQVLHLPIPQDGDHGVRPQPAPMSTRSHSHGDERRRETAWTPSPVAEQDESQSRPGARVDVGPTTPEQRVTGDSTTETQPADATASSPDITLLRGLLATAVCLAAGSFALLIANRRRQLRNRRPGRTIREVPTDLKASERTIYETGSAGEPAARFVDLALRQLADEARSAGAELPELGLAVLDVDALTILLTEPAVDPAPTGWRESSDRLVWSIPRTVKLGDSLLVQPSPYPALVSFAEDAVGRTWLLDLESVGTVTIGGDERRAEDLARFIVAELAVNAWAEGVEVILINRTGAELVGLNPVRVRRCDAQTAVRRAASKMSNEDGPAVELLSRRRDDNATDSTSPLVLICGEAAPAATVVAAPRSGVVVVVETLGSESDAVETPTLMVGRDGHLRLAGFTDALVSFGLSTNVAGQMARLLAETRSVDDEAMPDSTSIDGLAEVTTADGAIRPDLTTPRDPHGDRSSLLPDADTVYLDRTATTEQDLATLAPAVPDVVRRKIEVLDPDLDLDLRDWLDAASERPKVRVLGPVDVSATAGDRANVPNIGGTVEFIVYLACKEHGVTKDRAAEDLGWSGSTVQNRARDARRVLGQRPDGGEWLPDATKSDSAKGRGVATYQLDPGVLIDADLFRRLRTRATARGADGLDDLVKGLSLVRGEPFDQLRRGGYGWLLEGDRLDHHLCASIADASHLVADRALVDSDLELAREACRVALLVDPYSDVVRLDLAALAVAEGRSPDEVVRDQVLDRVDEDPATRTDKVLKRRGWLAS